MKYAFLINTWSAYRDFIHGGVLRELLALDPACRLLLVLSHDFPVLPDSLRSHPSVSCHHMDLDAFGPLEKGLYRLARDLYLVEHPGTSFSIRERMAMLRGQSTAHRRLWCFRLLHRLGLRSRHLRALTGRIGRCPAFRTLLETEQPDLVIYENVLPGKLHAIVEARRLRIPLVAALSSWDKASSKGPLTCPPDHLLAWSPPMADLAARCHDLPRNRIHCTGGLYFDVYFPGSPEHPAAESRDDFARRLGLPPGRRYLLFAMSQPEIIPATTRFAEVLARLTAQDAFGPEAHLIIRVSPKDDTPSLPGLAGPRVTLARPSGVDDPAVTRFIPSADEAFDRVNTLRHCDVIISLFSSILLDAACLDRPHVGLAYDAGPELPPHLSVKRFLQFDHTRQILGLDCTWIAEDDDSLVRGVRACMENPALFREGRARAVADVIGFRDGRSCQRYADILHQLAQRPRP